jgi:hypothetical protein
MPADRQRQLVTVAGDQVADLDPLPVTGSSPADSSGPVAA